MPTQDTRTRSALKEIAAAKDIDLDQMLKIGVTVGEFLMEYMYAQTMMELRDSERRKQREKDRKPKQPVTIKVEKGSA